MPHVNPDHRNLLGRVLIALARYDEAEKVLTLSEDLREEADDVMGSFDDNLYLAHISLWRGKLEVAGNLKNDAQGRYEKEDSLVGLADTLVLDGILSLRKSYLLAAQISFEKEMELYVQIRYPLGQAVGLYHLGIYFLRSTNLEPVMGSFQEALLLPYANRQFKGQVDDLINFRGVSAAGLHPGSIDQNI